MESYLDTASAGGIGVGILISIFLVNLLQLERPITVPRFFGILACYVLVVVAVVPVLLLWCLFLLYRQAIHLILKAKYGARYKGLVCGVDAMHLVDKKNTITAVGWTKNLSKRPPEEVVQKLRDAIWRVRELPKFQVSMHCFGGYWYKKQEDMHIDKYMKYLPKLNKPLLEEHEVLKLVNDCYNEKIKDLWLPWEIYLGTEPANWKNDGFEYYPFYYNIHHSVTDGVSLMKIVLGIFADKTENREATAINTEKKKKKSFNIFSAVRLVCSVLWVVLVFPASIFTTFLLHTKYSNFLPTLSSSNKKVFVWAKDSGEYISKVKDIKNAISASFPEVLFCAYAASLGDFIQKNNPRRPEFVTTIVPLLPAATKLTNMEPKDVDLKTLHVSNTFSIVIMKTPTNKRSLKELLRLVRKEGDIVKKLSSFQINYVMLNYFTAYLPVIFNWVIIKLFCRGSAISIVPGSKKIIFDQGTLENASCFAWVPQLNQFGITVVIVTYAGHFQIGLSVDAALIPEEKMAQEILDGLFKYLDTFAMEAGVSGG